MIQIMHRERLLFRTLLSLLEPRQRLLPSLVVLNERIVLEGVVDPFDVDLGHRMSRQTVCIDIVGCHTEKARLGHTEELFEMGAFPEPTFSVR